MALERRCDLSNSKSRTMVKEKIARLQKYRIKHVNTKLKKKKKKKKKKKESIWSPTFHFNS